MELPNARETLTNLSCVVGCAENQLGGSVVSGADIRDVWLVFHQDFGTAKIAELQNTCAWIQQKILWLDVAMTNALGMYVCEGTEELVDVELDFKDWHGRLHLVKISRGTVNSLGDIFLYKVEVDLILLPDLD